MLGVLLLNRLRIIRIRLVINSYIVKVFRWGKVMLCMLSCSGRK